MIKALIADDEAPAREELKHLLGELEGVEVVGEARDGPAAWEAINNLKPDLVFLDIRMPGLTGIELAHALNDSDNPPKIVFVTAFDQYAVEAFETEALDYILKPVEPERLIATVERARKSIGQPETGIGGRIEELLSRLGKGKTSARRITVKKGPKTLLMYPREIVFMEVEEGVVRAVGVTSSGTAPYRSLDEAKKDLPENFFRANRTYLVNLDHIKEIARAKEGAWELIMDNRHTIPLSRAQARKLRKFIKW